jgi:glutamine synthetase
VRVAWCDVHGIARSKVLVPAAAERALRSGVTMVSTLMLKDLAGRTVYKVFEPGGTDSLPGFGQANNLVLLPDPTSLRHLPWTESTGWLRADVHFADGRPVELDPRRVLLRALERLAAAGLGLQCGLEVEFHIYRIEPTPGGLDPRLDPDNTSTPGVPGCVSMVHPGANMLSEQWFDQAEAPLRIVQRTAQALGLPLLSLEIELGPSQVEAVFDVTDALAAADKMVLFRNGVKQALQRAGYHATFMCRPPLPNVMSSGWHLHQSLVNAGDGATPCAAARRPPGCTPRDAATRCRRWAGTGWQGCWRITPPA